MHQAPGSFVARTPLILYMVEIDLGVRTDRASVLGVYTANCAGGSKGLASLGCGVWGVCCARHSARR